MFSDWPEWMQQTHATLQKSLTDAAQQVPANVEADERQLAKVQKQLDRLLVAIARKSSASQRASEFQRSITFGSGSFVRKLS